jgi:nitroreductase
MTEPDLASVIPRRKSVRLYRNEALSADVLSGVRDFALSASPLFSEKKIAFRVLHRDEIRSMTPLLAPHYLALYSARDPDSDMNSGFLMEQADLFLSYKGFGSCWLGMASPAEKSVAGMPIAALLAFGAPAEDAHRSSPLSFRRKPLREIASDGTLPGIIESVRLAPSAMNKQPWFFCGDGQSCKAFSVPGTTIVNLADRWRFIDLGIALSFLYVAANAEGRTVSFRREDSTPCGSGREYMLTCRLSP